MNYYMCPHPEDLNDLQIHVYKQKIFILLMYLESV